MWLLYLCFWLISVLHILKSILFNKLTLNTFLESYDVLNLIKSGRISLTCKESSLNTWCIADYISDIAGKLLIFLLNCWYCKYSVDVAKKKEY